MRSVARGARLQPQRELVQVFARMVCGMLKTRQPDPRHDDGAVKADKPKKYGRAIDDGTVKAKGKKEHGRAIDDGTVKAPGASDKPGRAVDEQKK
jgi:hypothetical protein